MCPFPRGFQCRIVNIGARQHCVYLMCPGKSIVDLRCIKNAFTLLYTILRGKWDFCCRTVDTLSTEWKIDPMTITCQASGSFLSIVLPCFLLCICMRVCHTGGVQFMNESKVKFMYCIFCSPFLLLLPNSRPCPTRWAVSRALHLASKKKILNAKD